MFSLRRLFHLATFFIVFSATLDSAASVLPPEEVSVLREIGKTLGQENWNFSVDPCSGEWNWKTLNPMKGFENAVNCSCDDRNSTDCHVVGIILKSQSLQGRLPPELVKLPFLQEIDLSRNYLNGTIPREWGSMQLVKISILGNRISGEIPKELANIRTLVELVLEFNHLSGTIPPEFGNLPNIERILLSSNNLTGELPGTLANVATLKDFRIGDNQFVGSIPNFIKNWTNIKILAIQGSGLNGPIPVGIASLTNLTDLRISDLKGKDSAFPPLSNAKDMETLILRSCNIVGELPQYLGLLTKLKNLDLSFNKISGPIPQNFLGSSKLDNVYLSGNLLTGPVPDGMPKAGNNIDLSFNNLTYKSCEPGNLNLFASSSVGKKLAFDSCWRVCTQTWYSLHINCGGSEVKVDGDTSYEDDIDSGGPSKFFRSRTNWASSSTGHFLNDDRSPESYIWTNTSRISGNNSQLYMDARLSPLSLTYYGFCLKNGNYSVNLHFAEIMFTDDRNYSSLGRRLFDIYIQEKLEKKDFNIEDAAGGVNKAIVLPYRVEVSNNTLEIRFYWAGKGTTGIPVRGVYGPLISAISAISDFRPPSEHRNSLSAGAIVGIVLAVIFSISFILVLLWWKGCFGLKDTMEQADLMGLDLHTGSFTLRQIKAATNNFDAANKIGEGGFGSVYKGNLSDGTIIAVKQLSSKSKQGNREFVNEIGMISALQHPNLVKLYGCCIEANQLLLVYEYLENNSLARGLFGPKEHQLKLDWPTRLRISIGIARGLAYLHEESRLKIVHRDIKATNVLLDKDLNPKISDFGLAKLDEEENTHISTRIAGTYGYMAPEYAMRGYLTDKADVYSFGIVLLEIVSGKCNTSIKPKEDCFYVLDWAHLLKEEGKLMELVDSRLESNFNKKEVMLTINLALHCTNVSPTGRPSMSTVVSILEGRVVDKSLITYSDDKAAAAEESVYQRLLPNNNAAANDKHQQVQSLSIDLPWAASSESTSDLYPVGLDSHYLENRL